MPDNDENWWRRRVDADRAEVSEWFRSKPGQWVLGIIIGCIAVWLVVQVVWSLL